MYDRLKSLPCKVAWSTSHSEKRGWGLGRVGDGRRGGVGGGGTQGKLNFGKLFAPCVSEALFDWLLNVQATSKVYLKHGSALTARRTAK